MSKRLGELLINAGAARPEDIRAALELQTAGDGRRLGTILLEQKSVKSDALARALSELHDVPYVEVRGVDPAVGSLLSAEFLTESRMVPFKLEKTDSGDRIHLAVEDPSDFALVDELRFQLRKAITLYVAPVDQIDTAIEAIRNGLTAASVEVEEEIPLEEEIELEGEVVEEEDAPTTFAAAPVSTEIELPDEWADPTPNPTVKNELRDAKPAAEVFELSGKAPGVVSPAPVEGSAARTSTPVAAVGSLGSPAAAEAPRTVTPVGGTAAVSSRGSPAAAEALRTVTPPGGSPAVVAPLTSTPAAGVAAVATDAAVSEAPLSVTPPNGTTVAPQSSASTEAKPTPNLDFSEADLAVLDAIERLAGGDDTVVETEKVKPARMVAALTRLLMKKGVIDEHEFLDELARK